VKEKHEFVFSLMKILVSKLQGEKQSWGSATIYNSRTGEAISFKAEEIELHDWEVPDKESGHFLKVRFTIRWNPHDETPRTFFIFKKSNFVYCVEGGWERVVCSFSLLSYLSTRKVKIIVESDLVIMIDKDN